MHKLLLKELIASVRRRSEQGDCPTEPPVSHERLEHAVDALASENEKLRSLVRRMSVTPMVDWEPLFPEIREALKESQ